MRTRAKRWPKTSEEIRVDTHEFARDIERLLTKARAEITRNPLLAELMIADARANAIQIKHLMEKAKHGSDAE